MASLQRTLTQSPKEYPWQSVNETILSDAADPEALMRQGLKAQRDWILRGGRETPGQPLGRKAKSLLGKLLTQLLVFVIFTVLAVVLLLLLKQKAPELDIYRLLSWLQDTFPQAFPRLR